MANELKLKLSIEGGEVVTAEIDAAEKSMNKYSDSINASSAASSKFTSATSGWQQNMAGVDAAMRATVNTSVDLSKETQKLLDRYDPLGTKLRSLQSDLALLRREMGNSSSDAAFKTFAGLEADIEKTSNLMSTAGVDGFKKMGDAADKGAFSTAGAKRELMVLGHEAMQGNFSKMPGSFMVLAERMDLTTMLTSPLTIGLGLVAAAGVVVGVAFYEGAKESSEFNKQMALTNDYAGITKGQFNDMATSIANSSTVGIGTAKDVMQGMIVTGRFAGDTFNTVAATAVEFAHQSGASAEDVVKDFASMSSGVVAWATKHNEQYHFLSAAQYQHIAALEKEGETSLAVQVTMDAFNEHLQKNVVHLGYLSTAFQEVKKFGSEWWDMMKGIGRDTTLDDMISVAAQRALEQQSTLEGMSKNNPFYAAQAKMAKEATDALNGLYRAQANMAEGVKNAAANDVLQADASKAIARNNKLKESIRSKQQVEDDYVAAYLKDQDVIAQAGNVEVDTAKQRADTLKYFHDTYNPDEKAKAVSDANNTIAASIAKVNAAALLQLETGDKLSASDKFRIATLSQIDEALRKGDIKLEQSIALESKMHDAEMNMQSVDAQKEQNKALADAEKSYNDLINSIGKASDATLKGLDTSIAKQREHNAEIGKTKEQIDLIKQATDDALTLELSQQAQAIDLLLQKNQAALEECRIEELISSQAQGIYETELARLNAAIAKRKEFSQVLADGAVLEAAHKADTEWQKTATSISTYLTDGFSKSITNGESRFVQMRDSVEAMFKRMVLNFAINGTVNAAGQALGISGSAGSSSVLGAVGNGASIYNAATGAYSAYGSLGSAYGGFSAGYGEASLGASFVGPPSSLAGGVYGTSASLGEGAAGLTGATTTGTGAVAGTGLTELGGASAYDAGLAGVGSNVGAGVAVGTGTEVGGGIAATEAGLSSTGYGIIIAAVIAIVYAMMPKFTSAQSTGDGSISFDASGNQTGSSSHLFDGQGGLNSVTAKFITTLQDSYTAAAKNLGIGTIGTYWSAGSNTGQEGKNPNFAVAVNAGSASYSSGETGVSTDSINLVVSRAIMTALQASELPKYLSGVFDGLTASSATQAQLDTALATAQSFKLLHDQLQALPFDYLKDMSYASASGLVAAAGSMANLGTALGTYYDKFYVADEKTALLTKNTTDAFASLGVVMPTVNDQTRAWYRSEVDRLGAMDMSVSANAKAYVGALSLATAVDTLAPAMTAASASVRSLSDIANERSGLQNQLDQLTLTSTQLLDKQRSALDASNQGLFDQVQAATSAKAASDAAAQASIDAATQAASDAATQKQIATDRASWQTQLDVLTGSTTQLQATRSAQLAAVTDTATLALMNQVYAQQDSATAATAAKQASDAMAASVSAMAQRVSSAMSSLSDTRQGLQSQLLTAQGDPAGALALTRANALAKLTDGLSATDSAAVTASYNYNAGLEDQIKALNDAASAAAAAAAAQASAAAAAQSASDQIKSAWQSVTDSIFSEVQRIRGLMAGTSAASYAQAQAQFSIANAQASAGDQTAAKLLPQLSQTLLTLAEANATSLAELRRIQGQTAASLSATGSGLATSYGLKLPSFDVGTDYVPFDMIAKVHQGEQIKPRAYNPHANGNTGTGNADLISALNKMEQRLARMQAQLDQANALALRTATATNGNPENIPRVKVQA